MPVKKKLILLQASLLLMAGCAELLGPAKSRLRGLIPKASGQDWAECASIRQGVVYNLVLIRPDIFADIESFVSTLQPGGLGCSANLEEGSFGEGFLVRGCKDDRYFRVYYFPKADLFYLTRLERDGEDVVSTHYGLRHSDLIVRSLLQARPGFR